jgi:hypothetical protein
VLFRFRLTPFRQTIKTVRPTVGIIVHIALATPGCSQLANGGAHPSVAFRLHAGIAFAFEWISQASRSFCGLLQSTLTTQSGASRPGDGAAEEWGELLPHLWDKSIAVRAVLE